MRVATAGILLAGLIVTSACSNKAATTSSDASTAAPADSAAPAAAATDAAAATATDTPAPDATATTLTVQTKNGTATLSGDVDPSKLGAPIYPGAQANPEAQGSFSASTNEGSTVIATFKTTDPFDKVYDYYKSQLPTGSEAMKMSMGGASTAQWQIGKEGSADQVVVQVTSDKAGQVTILITHTIKNNVSPAPSPT
jgi:hypothetical protein